MSDSTPVSRFPNRIGQATRGALMAGAVAALALLSNQSLAANASIEPASLSASSGIRFVDNNDDPALAQLNRFYAGTRTTANPAFVAKAMAKHTGLPQASIAVISSNSSVGQSAAFPDPVTGQCFVQIAVDSSGLTEAPRSVAEISLLPITPNSPLALSLTEFETLHELGHCQHAVAKTPFAHPALNSSDSALLAQTLRFDRNAGVLHRELYADAFAAIRYIQARSSDPVGAARELTAIQHWRSVSTHDHLSDENPEAHPTDIRKPRFDKAEHATAALLADILKRPRAFLDVDPDATAATLASSHLGKVFSTASDAGQTAQTLLDPQARILDSISASMPFILAEGAPKGDARVISQMAKKQFDSYQYGSPVEKAIFEQTDLLGRIALERAPAYLTDPSKPLKHSSDEQLAQQAKAATEISAALARHPEFKASLARLGYGPEQESRASQALDSLKAAEKPSVAPETLWPAADKLVFRKTLLEWRSGRQNTTPTEPASTPEPSARAHKHRH